MRVFISFSQDDQPVVDAVRQRLQAAGHEVVADRPQLKAGDNIARKIEDEVAAAEALVLVVSQAALSSQWLQQEFSSLALSELSRDERKVIPVVVGDAALPSYLARYLCVELGRNLEEGLDRLMHRLATLERKDTASMRARRAEADGHASQLAHIRAALKEGRLSLMCGAGVSVDAGIPVWSELLDRLFEAMLERLSNRHRIGLAPGAEPEAAPGFGKRPEASSLILGKYLKNNLGKDFATMVRDTLYAGDPRSCALIDAIVDLARPQRDGKPLDSIISFNFDGLIEEQLRAAHVAARPIHSEAIQHELHELPVYHVHGYLPRTGRIPDGTDLVFSDDAYHGQFMDPFSWSNLIQLNKLTQNTCLFVGVSLTDPNMRRLLDVAWRKNPDKTLGHYVIKKRPTWDGSGAVLDEFAALLEEQDANALGIHVIWVDSYDEIPALLRLMLSPVLRQEP
jgi:hypothetical protein